MQVRFIRWSGPRYAMQVVPDRGSVSPEVQAPGFDAEIPHDAVHFIVEAEAGITGGVFGRLATGGRPSGAGADMARSEGLVSLCTALWERRHGRRDDAPAWFGMVDERERPPGELVERILGRLDRFADEWRPLPVGGSVTLDWPHRPAGVARRKRR